MYIIALAITTIFISFILGVVAVYTYFRKRHNVMYEKYYRELSENYNLELQNKWLRESIQKLNAI